MDRLTISILIFASLISFLLLFGSIKSYYKNKKDYENAHYIPKFSIHSTNIAIFVCLIWIVTSAMWLWLLYILHRSSKLKSENIMPAIVTMVIAICIITLCIFVLVTHFNKCISFDGEKISIRTRLCKKYAFTVSQIQKLDNCARSGRSNHGLYIQWLDDIGEQHSFSIAPSWYGLCYFPFWKEVHIKDSYKNENEVDDPTIHGRSRQRYIYPDRIAKPSEYPHVFKVFSNNERHQN